MRLIQQPSFAFDLRAKGLWRHLRCFPQRLLSPNGFVDQLSDFSSLHPVKSWQIFRYSFSAGRLFYGSNGMTISADRTRVYVNDPLDFKISVMRRDPASGLLRQWVFAHPPNSSAVWLCSFQKFILTVGLDLFLSIGNLGVTIENSVGRILYPFCFAQWRELVKNWIKHFKLVKPVSMNSNHAYSKYAFYRYPHIIMVSGFWLGTLWFVYFSLFLFLKEKKSDWRKIK